jgi:hypothetical protein
MTERAQVPPGAQAGLHLANRRMEPVGGDLLGHGLAVVALSPQPLADGQEKINGHQYPPHPGQPMQRPQ